MIRIGRNLVGALLVGVTLAGSVAVAAPPGPPSAQFIYDAAGRLTGVFNLLADPSNCGAVGNVCPTFPGTEACCVAGACGFAEQGLCFAGLPVTVSVDPAAATVQTGGGLWFTATVANTPDPSVMWFVNGIAGGSADFGTIDGSLGSNAYYQAPASIPSPASFYVQVLSLADFTTYASALVTVVSPVSITISPLSATVAVGGTQQFTAAVTNAPAGTDPTVSWSVNGIPGGDATVGTVSTFGLYSAPTTVPIPAAVTVTATANSNWSMVASATATITTAPVAVQLSPGPVSLGTGKTQQFAALVQNTTNKAVTWKVNGITGGNSTLGTISTAGLYTAPAAMPNPAVVTVSAVASADATKSAATTVTVVAQSVSVAVAPATLAIRTAQTQQFAATVKGSANTAVTWKVNGTSGGSTVLGTISATGLYTAPAAVPSPATVTVSAVSTADASKSGAAATTITTSTAVLVSVNPTSAIVAPSATQQFTATIQNTSTKTVTWKVNGIANGNSTVGTISTAGSYKAPATVPTPAAVTVTAISTVDTTRSGAATATVVKPITVAVTPTSASVQAGLAKQFTTTVLNTTNTAVTWLVNGVPGGDSIAGTVSSTGLYQAPGGVPTPVSVSVAAVSSADPTISARSTVTVTGPAVSVTVSPATASVTVGKKQQFSVAVGNTTNTTVTWKVNGTTGGSATLGTVTTSGLYTAPSQVPSPATVSVKAVSAADTSKSGTASVSVATTPMVSVEVTPVFAKLELGLTLQFSATVLRSTNQGVTWSVNGVTGGDAVNGTIDLSGLYTAPFAMPTGPVAITAPSEADSTAIGSASVTLLASVPVTLSLNPTSVYLAPGSSKYFVATVQNTSDTSVTWLVNGIPGGSDAVGFIYPDGLYQAPQAAPGEFITITAVSNADDAKFASATVNLLKSQVSTVFMGPPNPSVPVGQWFVFAASVDAAPGQSASVVWLVNGSTGGDSIHGTIDSYGVYTAPSAVPPDPVIVTAASVADPASRASTTVTVTIAPPVVVTPSSAAVQIGTTFKFSPTVTLPIKTLTWTVNGVVGGNTTIGTIDVDGLYTAPASVPVPPTVTIVATSTADTSQSATATATITAVPQLSISGPNPTPTLVQVGGTQQMSALVQNATDTSVTWLVNGVVGGSSTTGTISASGLFVAPGVIPAPDTVTVTAVSNADPTKSVSGTITITPIPPPLIYVRNWQGVLLQPCAPYWLQANGFAQFYGSIKNDSSGALMWQVNGVTGGDATNGLINAQGGYTAPPVVPEQATVVITAALQSDPSMVFPIFLTVGP